MQKNEGFYLSLSFDDQYIIDISIGNFLLLCDNDYYPRDWYCDMGEKTEQASPKKLKDARNKGQVARSQDFPSVFTFVISIGLTVMLAPWLYDKLGGFLVQSLKSFVNNNLHDSLAEYYQTTMQLIISTTAPILGITAIAGVLVNFLIVGPTMALEVFKPDIKRFNPVENLKNKFKLKTLVELIKSILKILGAILIIYLVTEKYIQAISTAVLFPVIQSIAIVKSILIEVVLKVGIFFLVIGVFDLIYQKRVFAKEMMMEKFEVKQEFKDTEGNPEIKGKRRQIAQEIAYEEGPRSVARAKAIVTNPTYLAIALGYEPEKGITIPYVLMKGKGNRAKMIVKAAKKYGVPIIHNVELAHMLINVEVYKLVPKKTWELVAEVLKWVLSLEQNRENS